MHCLLHAAIDESGVTAAQRDALYRTVVIAGGVTETSGFVQRLHTELSR